MISTDESLSIERGQYEDIYDILTLYRRCALNGALNDALSGNAQWDEEYPSFETVEYDLDNQALYVVRKGGRIAAAISLFYEEGMDDCGWARAKMTCILARICVEPELQHQGIGTRLVEFACAQAAAIGCQTMRMVAEMQNAAVIGIHRKLRFQRIGFRRLYGVYYLMLERIL